jgi:hypothetical protein
LHTSEQIGRPAAPPAVVEKFPKRRTTTTTKNTPKPFQFSNLLSSSAAPSKRQSAASPNPNFAAAAWPDGVRGSGGAAAGDVRRRHGEAIRRLGRVRRPLRPRIRPRGRKSRQRRQVEPHQ